MPSEFGQLASQLDWQTVDLTVDDRACRTDSVPFLDPTLMDSTRRCKFTPCVHLVTCASGMQCIRVHHLSLQQAKSKVHVQANTPVSWIAVILTGRDRHFV